MDDKLTEKQVENLIIKSRQCGRTFQAFLKAIAESGKKCIEEFENFEKYKNFTFADIRKPEIEYELLNKENADKWISDQNKQGFRIEYENTVFEDGREYPIQAVSNGDIFVYDWEKIPTEYEPATGGTGEVDQDKKNQFKDFMEKFKKYLYENSDIPIEILKMELSPEWIKHMKWNYSPMPSIDPFKDESIDPDTKCAECVHPDECEICLSAFEASRTRKEIAVTARIFSANVKLEEENAALKKLFIAEHREKNDLLQSIALHRGREKRLLRKTEELNNQISFRITSFDKIDSIIKGILQKRIGLCPPSKELLLMREICEEGITYGRK